MQGTGLEANTDGYVQTPPLGRGYLCFKFYYMMYGSGVGQLQVLVSNEVAYEKLWEMTGESLNDSSEITPHYLLLHHPLKLSGDSGNQWRLAEVPLPKGAARVKIVGVRGNNSDSDIALDDLQLMGRECHGNCGRLIICHK